MDKWGGDIVGERAPEGVSGAEASASSSVSELLVAADGSILSPLITPAGDVSWRPVVDAAGALSRVMGRSQMSSMLLDARRVSAYAEATARAVAAARLRLGREPRVLDIGAGTGLLSLLSARVGAASVDAFEQWPVMAAVATAVAAANASAGGAAVRVHAVHSGAARIDGAAAALGEVGALPAPADVVVSEIVDSALLGEGMLPALRDAYARGLINSDATCVPSRARIAAQLVWSDFSRGVQDSTGAVLRVGGEHPTVGLARTDWGAACTAHSVSLPLHADRGGWVAASDVFEACVLALLPASIAANEPDALIETVTPLVRARLGGPPRANAVLWWWVLEVSPAEGDSVPAIEYSTAPSHVATSTAAWQDHWVQNLTPLAAPVTPSEDGKGYTVVTTRSDTRLSFFAAPAGAVIWPSLRTRALAKRAAAASGIPFPNDDAPLLITEPQPCTCGLHRAAGSERRWALCDGDAGALLNAFRASIDASLDALVCRRVAEHADACADAGIDVRDAPLSLSVLDISEGSAPGLLAATATALARASSTVFLLDHGRVWSEHVRGLVSEHSRALTARVVILPAGSPSGVTGHMLTTEEEEEEEEGEEEGLVGEDAKVAEGVEGAAACGDAACADASGAAATIAADAEGGAAAVAEGAEDDVMATVGLGVVDAVVCDPLSFPQLGSDPLWAVPAWWFRRAALAPLLARDALVLPKRAHVFVQAVSLPTLRGSFGPVGTVAGFSHAPYDTAIGSTAWLEDAIAMPLWQYAPVTASPPARALVIDFGETPPRAGDSSWGSPLATATSVARAPPAHARVVLPRDEAAVRVGGEVVLVCSQGAADTLVLWVDWELSDGVFLNTGPRGGMDTNAPTPHRQALAWLRSPVGAGEAVTVGVWLDEADGRLRVRSYEG